MSLLTPAATLLKMVPVWALTLLLWVAATRAPTAETPTAAPPETLQQHAGKAGFYLRLAKTQRENNPEFFLSHPLVDAVIVTFAWSQVEPRPGEFDFAEIDSMIALCQKYKKGLVLAFSTYGQFPSLDNQPTPPWLYGQGVEKLAFRGGGVAKGQEVVIPKVWGDSFWPWYEKFVRKLGERYRHEKTIWYVMPAFGHIGNLNAQPTGDGGRALLKAGWTAEKWKIYCLKVTDLYQKEFPATPLIVKAATQLIKDRTVARDEDQQHRAELVEILKQMAARGVSIIRFGLEADAEKIKRSEVMEQFQPLIPLAGQGRLRLGIGDDWPLWVPAQRREVNFLADRDESGLKRILDYAFGGLQGLPETKVSIFYVLHPEIEASHPANPDGQNKAVFEALKAARERLIRDDPVQKLVERQTPARSGDSRGKEIQSGR